MTIEELEIKLLSEKELNLITKEDTPEIRAELLDIDKQIKSLYRSIRKMKNKLDA